MVDIRFFFGVTTPKYADIISNVNDTLKATQELVLLTLVFFWS